MIGASTLKKFHLSMVPAMLMPVIVMVMGMEFWRHGFKGPAVFFAVLVFVYALSFMTGYVLPTSNTVRKVSGGVFGFSVLFLAMLTWLSIEYLFGVTLSQQIGLVMAYYGAGIWLTPLWRQRRKQLDVWLPAAATESAASVLGEPNHPESWSVSTEQHVRRLSISLLEWSQWVLLALLGVSVLSTAFILDDTPFAWPLIGAGLVSAFCWVYPPIFRACYRLSSELRMLPYH